MKIAEDIAQRAVERGLRAKASTMDAWGWAALSAAATPRLLLILSTHDGHPPPNAVTFCGAAAEAAAESAAMGTLQGVPFSVLGLGDSAFGADKFCAGQWLRGRDCQPALLMTLHMYLCTPGPRPESPLLLSALHCSLSRVAAPPD